MSASTLGYTGNKIDYVDVCFKFGVRRNFGDARNGLQRPIGFPSKTTSLDLGQLFVGKFEIGNFHPGLCGFKIVDANHKTGEGDHQKKELPLNPPPPRVATVIPSESNPQS